MACIKKEKIEQLFREIGKYINKSDLPNYSHIEHMKDFYTKFISANLQPSTALSFVQLMPKYINFYLSLSNKKKDIPRQVVSDLSFAEIDFENNNLEFVANYIGVGTSNDPELEPVEVNTNDIIQEAKGSVHSVFNGAKPMSALSTTLDERRDDKSFSKDPIKTWYHEFNRKFLKNAKGTIDGSTVTVNGHTGFKLKAVKMSSMPYEEMYEYLINTYTSEAELKEYLDKYKFVALVISDNEGNMLKFDENHNITPDGKHVYFHMRETSFDLLDDPKARGRIQSVEKISEKLGITLEKATQLVKQQVDQLRAVQKGLFENSKDNIFLDIDGGSPGYLPKITPNSNVTYETAPSTLGELVGDEPFTIEYETVGRVPRRYIMFNGTNVTLLSKKITLEEAELFANVIVDNVKRSEGDTVAAMEFITQYVAMNKENRHALESIISLNLDKPEIIRDFIYKDNSRGLVRQLTYQGKSASYYGVKNNKLVGISSQEYNNYWKDVLKTPIPLNDDGKIELFNSYLTFSLSDKTQEDLGIIKKEEPTKKSAIVNFGNTNIDIDNLLKEYGITSKATKEQIIKAYEWYKNHPMSATIPFTAMFNVINSNAKAAWGSKGIVLYKGSNYTDLYHEAWHGFSQMFLSLKDKQELYSEVGKLSGEFSLPNGTRIKFSEAKPLQIEEFLAEDFRGFAMSNGKKILGKRPIRNGVFKRIYAFLKWLFDGVSYKEALLQFDTLDHVKKLYDKLYTGNMVDMKPDAQNVLFRSLNKPIGNSTEVLTLPQSDLVADTIDSIVSDILHKIALEKGRNIFGNFLSSKQSLKNLYTNVKSVLNDRLTVLNADAETNSYAIHVLNIALNNFGDIEQTVNNKELNNGTTISYHLKRSKLFDISSIKAEDDEVVDKASQGDGQSNKERADAGELSFEELANEKVLFLIRTLKDYNEDGSINKNDLGFSKLGNYNRMLGILIKNLNDNTGPFNIYKRLLELQADDNHFAKEIIDKLGPLSASGNTSSMESYNSWVLFANSFNTTSLPLIITKLEQTVTQEGLEYNFYNIQGQIDVTSTKNKFIQDFLFDQNNPISVNSPDGRVLSKTKLQQEFGSYFDPDPNGNSYYNKFKTGSAEKVKIAIDFYRALGIDIDNSEDFQKLLSTKKVLEGAHFSYNYLMNYPTGRNSDFIPDHLRVLTSSKKDTQASVINDVLAAYVKIKNTINSFSLLNAEGNRQYENILNNMITITKNGLNEATSYQDLISKDEFSHLNVETNPMVRASLIFKKLFGEGLTKRTNNKLVIHNYTGIQLQKENVIAQQLGINDVDPATKFYIDFYSYLNNGYIELPRHADKKMSMAYFTEEDPYFINPSDYIQNSAIADDKFVEYMFGYLKAEHERVYDIKNNTVNDLNNFPDFKNQGKEFLIFHDILSPELKNELYEISPEDLNKLSADSELFLKIQESILSYLTNLTSENKEVFDSVKYIDAASFDKLTKGYKSKKVLTTNEKTTRLLRAYSANTFIYHVESTIMFYGDIAAYNHLKEEFHKRNASAGSTGKTFVSDKSFLEQYNQYYGNKYAESKGYKSYGIPSSGVLNAGIFEDIQVEDTKVIESYRKSFKTKYLIDYAKNGFTGKALEDKAEEQTKKAISKYFANEIKEGDGQGWITMDAYRQLAVLSKEWSQEQEILYNKIVNNIPIGIDEYTKVFPPRKYQYFGPIKTDKYHMNSLHKFSLLPLVPEVIKDKNLEVLHERMMNNNTHYATFKSGSKLANRTDNGKMDSLYSNVSNRQMNYEDVKITNNQLNLKYLRNQVSINDEFKEEVVFSTQMRALILNELYEDGKAINKDIDALAKSYLSSIDAYIDYNRQKIKDEIELKSNGDFNNEKLADIIKQEMDRKDLPEHLQEVLTIVDGKFKYDLSFALNAADIEGILFSILNRRIVKRKVNGEPLIQAATTGFEPKRSKNPTPEELKQYSADDLKFYRVDPKTGKTLPMEVKIALQGGFKKLLELKHPDGKRIGTRERLNEAIKDEVWNKTYNRLFTLVGVRIPIQGFNSMEMMTVKEFLPESAGPIIVPPTQIVAKAGSDFDIDKLSIFFPNIYLSKDKQKVALDTKGNGGLENDMTTNIIDLLSRPEIFESLIRPNDTDKVEPLSKEMLKYFSTDYNPKKNNITDPENMSFVDDSKPGKIVTRPVSPTKIFETRYNIYKQFSNSVGKKALGIGAVDNKFNALFNQVGFETVPSFSHTRVDKKGTRHHQDRSIRLLLPHNASENGGISLSKIFNKEGEKIADIINQLMNGWVDVAKDPWIAYVMGTPEAAPVLLYLVQAGVPFRHAVYFLAQPVIRDYFAKLKEINSPLSATKDIVVQDGDGYKIISSLPENEFRLKTGMLKINNPFASGHDLWNSMMSKTKDVKEFSEKELKANLDNSLLEGENIGDQQAIFAHFLETLDVANGLFRVKQSLNFDTKTSSTLFESFTRNKKRDLLMGETLEDNNYFKMFPTDKSRDLYNKTIIHNFDISDLQTEMFGDRFGIRNNTNLNKYLNAFYANNYNYGNKLLDKVMEVYNNQPSKLITEFKNDFTTYAVLNTLRNFNIRSGKYKGFDIVDVSTKQYNKLVEKDFTNTPSEYTNHSGGAYGGDTYWDLIGREFGVTNHKHYKDASNANLSQQLRNKGIKAEILTKEQMDFARQKVKELLGVEYKDDLRGNLQVRNFYQVYNADAVYAIAKLDTNKGFNSTAVLGGTNTAVQLGIKLNKPVYVWDIFTEQWYIFNNQNNNLPKKDVKINIYAGANQNTELSNFAIRPFKTNIETSSGNKEYTFQSVEQGFHFYKAVVANNPQVAAQILKTTNGGTLRNLTNRNNLKMNSEQVKEWDDTSKSIMLNLMYDSYVQNPDKAQLLLNTGEATITHTQDNTRWKTDFPEVVMTVRDMLKEEGFSNNKGVFQKTETPILTKNFAGIGSRDIENYNVQKDGKWQPREEYVGKEKEEKAKQAIKDVYEKTFKTADQREYTPEKITELKPNEVFVFGSNTEGRHGKGAALDAKTLFGAKQGQATGLQGKSYAIVTKNLTKGVEFMQRTLDKTGERSVPLEDIGEQFSDLFEYANNHPEKKFYVSKLGSSLAGYSVDEIRNEIKEVNDVNGGNYIGDNVILPKEYEVRDILKPESVTGVNQNIPGYVATGVYVKDGKIYMDLETLREQYNNGQYYNDYQPYGVFINGLNNSLSKLKPNTFEVGGFTEYVNFVMEREYLRNSMVPSDMTSVLKTVYDLYRKDTRVFKAEFTHDINKNNELKKLIATSGLFVRNEYGLLDLVDRESGELMLNNVEKVKGDNFKLTQYTINKPVAQELELVAVEEYLKEAALKNIYNAYSFMNDPTNAYALQVGRVITKYSELSARYGVISRLTPNKSKKGNIYNLVLTGTVTDPNELENFYQELLELADAGVTKVSDPVANLEISKLFAKMPFYTLLATGYSTNTRYSLNKIVDQTAILNLSSDGEIQEYLDRVLSDDKFENNLNNFSEMFIKHRLGLVKSRNNNFNTPVGFNLDNSKRKVPYVSRHIPDRKPLEFIDDTNNLMTKSEEGLYLIDIQELKATHSNTKDLVKHFNEIAEVHSDKLFILNSREGLPRTIKGPNIVWYDQPKSIISSTYSGDIVLPKTGLVGSKQSVTDAFSEALFTKFAVKNPQWKMGLSKETILQRMNSDSFITTPDIINDIRLKSYAVLEEIKNSCNI